MNELTLESLAARVAELERQFAALTLRRSWMSWSPPDRTPEQLEYFLQVEAEMATAREAEREAARAGNDVDDCFCREAE